jgi:hypothetical protein
VSAISQSIFFAVFEVFVVQLSPLSLLRRRRAGKAFSSLTARGGGLP